ncbi:MAG: hypothetical protein HY525_15965 [Betaproteobacteria bacterium]|nr:hypothetical protein [Betaproteobacteria bacterium]
MMKNAVSGLGLAPDAAMVSFPIDMFLPDSDLAPLRARKREFYDGLTRWQSGFAQAAASAAPMLCVEGASYEDALIKANNLLLTNLRGDGLPLWPATRERVDWILRGSALSGAHAIGKFPPRGGVTTVETCAVALAMAGGRPEYLPVLIAAVEAFLDAESESGQLQATSGGAFPVVIVNGPIAKEIRLNSGFGCLGPDSQRPAGASIGRALRLLQQNVGGALPGIGTMAIFGAMRYTNAVFAEAEEALPQGWQPHATERHGLAPGTNSVSLVFASGVTNINRLGAKKETPEEEVLNGMWRMADFMRTPNIAALDGYEQGTPGIMMISPVIAKMMAELGWTQSSIRQFLWENSKIPMEQLKRAGVPAWIEIRPNPATRASIKLDPWPVTLKPGNIVLVVAGGDHPTHSHWLQAHSPRVIGRVMRVPESFDRLLADADRDLGCGSDACRT